MATTETTVSKKDKALQKKAEKQAQAELDKQYNESNPRPLPETIKRNGFVYKLYKRGKRGMIYSQHFKRKTGEASPVAAGYEVFILRIDKGVDMFGTWVPFREHFPANEEFGVIAWAYTGGFLHYAEAKFNEIEKGAIVDSGITVECEPETEEDPTTEE